MVTKRQRTLTLGASAACAAVGLTVVLILAFTGSPAPRAAPRPAVVTPTPRLAARQLLSPFTGEPIRSLSPVLTAKIDNIVTARPQTGLRSADIVYVLPVEGGLSRFLAVFSSHVPPVIGPVRSAREDDLELLRQFGRPALAFSGATPHLLPFVQRARIVDLYAGTAGGYFRSAARVAPDNLYAKTSALLEQAKAGRASAARDIGFRFSSAPPPGGRRASSFAASYPAASFVFRWSSSARRWLVSMDGAPARDTDGGQLGGATVVIQYTVVRTSRFLEYGKPPPFAQSDGSGKAVVLRDGRAYDVTWSRPSQDGGTVYRLPSGERMTFARGQVWVLLVSAR